MSVTHPIAGPLSGIVVVDLSRILAGPYCTMLMAELGARVIKIETPGSGDDSREYGPFRDGKSIYFSAVNRGKESVALDLKDAKDRRLLDELLARADLIVENFRPGTMERLGLGWEKLHAAYPRLIYLATSGFGHSGPHSTRPAYDMVVQGLGGIMSVTGHEDAAPARIGISIGDLGTALYAAIGVNAALYHRERTGQATKVDLAMFDCQLALMENPATRFLETGQIPGPLGGRHASITPFGIFQTQDAPIIIAAGNDALFVSLTEVLDRPDLTADARFSTNAARCAHVALLTAEIERVLATAPAADWLVRFDKAGLPCGPLNDVAQALAHPQVAARNMIVEIDDPRVGAIRTVGNPIKIEPFAQSESGRRSAAPELDEHRAKIESELASWPIKAAPLG